MKTQTKTNFELYLEYLKRYDLGHYLDQSLTFQPVVETVGDLLYTQREIGQNIQLKRCQETRRCCDMSMNILESLLQI
jgi:hypothetical protein